MIEPNKVISDQYRSTVFIMEDGRTISGHIANMGVFDFDEVLFSDIWNRATPGYWRRCTKYYESDHRPVWMQLRLP